MAQLPCTAIRMMLDRVSTQLIRRGSKCCITLLLLSIQTGRDQTGDAPQIASRSCINWQAANFANTRAFANSSHFGSILVRQSRRHHGQPPSGALSGIPQPHLGQILSALIMAGESLVHPPLFLRKILPQVIVARKVQLLQLGKESYHIHD